MALIQYNLCFDDEANKFVAVDPETGEVKDFTAPAAKKTTTRSKKKKEDESSEPQLILQENKYSLNTAAVELMGVQPDDKLNIKMRKIDKVMTPILGTNEAFKTTAGNRLTKSFTVACRGANNEALSAYGTIFTLEPNPDGSGTFILHGDKKMEPQIVDDNLEEDVTLPPELAGDIDMLNSDLPDDMVEIDGATFEQMLSSVD